MSTVFVPGVAATSLSGQIGAQPWAVTHHWQFGSSTTPWTQADLDTLTKAVYDAWGSAMKVDACTNVDTRQVTAIDLTNSSGLGSLYEHTPTTGTNVGLSLPSNTCVVVQNRIASRYRGGHPRTFWPLFSENQMQNESTWNQVPLTATETHVVAFVSAIISAGYTSGVGPLQHVIPRYTYTYTLDSAHHKYLKTRTGLEGVFVVQSYSANKTIGTQRRRLHI